MAEAEEVSWAPIYVLGAGFKKLNGAYIGAGNYEGKLRYKHPKELIWCFWAGDKQWWCFTNKSRYLEDGKILYKNKHNTDPDDPIPMKGWRYMMSPGVNPPPKVINSAFVKGEEVDIYSKKSNKWMEGKIFKVNEKGTYKCSIKGVKKPINIPRQQIRMLNDSTFTVKQFVEIKTKTGDWLLAMIGEVKDCGKYYIVLPDGKGATFPESKIRPTEMCRDAEEGGAPSGGDSPAETHTPVSGGDGSSAAALAEKDRRIAELERRIAQHESAGTKGDSFSEEGKSSSNVDPHLVREIMDKQKQLDVLVTDLNRLHAKLLSSLR